jgi:hypothetical protein
VDVVQEDFCTGRALVAAHLDRLYDSALTTSAADRYIRNLDRAYCTACQ